MGDREIYADSVWVEEIERHRKLHLFYRRSGKRILDLLITAPFIVMLAPLMGLFLLLVAMDGHKPLFSQERVGRGGRTFFCWKIRSMVPEAEQQLVQLLSCDPTAAAEWNEYQKLDNDPRITRIGWFLRRTSLDELPQLWNVIRGEMSLVGPRPVLREELQRYGDRSTEYISVKPGLTGPWQVSGRNSISYDERVGMDAAYARYYSLRGDLRLILLTGFTMVRLTGR